MTLAVRIVYSVLAVLTVVAVVMGVRFFRHYDDLPTITQAEYEQQAIDLSGIGSLARHDFAVMRWYETGGQFYSTDDQIIYTPTVIYPDWKEAK